MAEHVCPWWIGHLLASPLRKLWQDPHAILAPFVAAGMTALEPGPGVGFFTLELARLVGRGGQALLAEPRGHVSEALFAECLQLAAAEGLNLVSRPAVAASRAALLAKA